MLAGVELGAIFAQAEQPPRSYYSVDFFYWMHFYTEIQEQPFEICLSF